MRSIILVVLMMFSLSELAQAGSNAAPTTNGVEQKNSADAPVKKSKTGICHAPGSTYYSRTKNFAPFKTLGECLKSGGRLPKK